MVSGEHNGKVSYKHVPETILKLPLPLAAVDNMEEVERSKKKQKLERGKTERKSQKKSCQIFHFRHYWTSSTWATKLIFEMLWQQRRQNFQDFQVYLGQSAASCCECTVAAGETGSYCLCSRYVWV